MEGPNALGPEDTERLARVRLLVLDVDGVLTDGRVIYTEDGEAQAFSVYDGHALKLLSAEGVHVTWISGRGCGATRRRAAELGVEELHLGQPEKRSVLEGVQDRLGISSDETAAMGDDLPDLAWIPSSCFFACPANAVAEVRERARWVTKARGGEGAVRELVELILRAKGRWPSIADDRGE